MVDTPPTDPTQTETPEESVVTTTPAPAPAYVTQDQFSSMMNQMQENFQSGMQQMGQQIAGAVRPVVHTQEEPEPTDEEIDAAALEGRGVGAAVKRATRAAMRQYQRHNEEQVGQVRDIGLPALAEQGLEIAKGKWEHYDRFKKEIDAGLNQLPLELRARPSNLQYVYNMVVGQHEKELRTEAVEQAIRSRRETDDSQPAPRGKGVKADMPDAITVFGEENYQSLKRHGKDVETIAKKLGKTPEQYLEGVKRYNDRMRGAA